MEKAIKRKLGNLFTTLIFILFGVLSFYMGYTVSPHSQERNQVVLLGVYQEPGSTLWRVVYSYHGQAYSQWFKTKVEATQWMK